MLIWYYSGRHLIIELDIKYEANSWGLIMPIGWYLLHEPVKVRMRSFDRLYRWSSIRHRDELLFLLGLLPELLGSSSQRPLTSKDSFSKLKGWQNMWWCVLDFDDPFSFRRKEGKSRAKNLFSDGKRWIFHTRGTLKKNKKEKGGLFLSIEVLRGHCGMSKALSPPRVQRHNI